MQQGSVVTGCFGMMKKAISLYVRAVAGMDVVQVRSWVGLQVQL